MRNATQPITLFTNQNSSDRLIVKFVTYTNTSARCFLLIVISSMSLSTSISLSLYHFSRLGFLTTLTTYYTAINLPKVTTSLTHVLSPPISYVLDMYTLLPFWAAVLIVMCSCEDP